MIEVTAIIIDDEEHNRNVLKTLLNKYCPSIIIIDEASGVDDAYMKIRALDPKLIFLDIKMPEKNGFDLLKMFNEISFEIVFVSAFDEYAINAFDFNALGYILKPIDYLKLINVVNKAVTKIKLKEHNNNLMDFVKTIDSSNDFIDKLSVHHNDKVVFIKILDIISIKADGNISEINLITNEQYFSSKSLKLFEGMLLKLDCFIRINKSEIININCIKSYKKGDFFEVEMINGDKFEVSRRKKPEVLDKIKKI